MSEIILFVIMFAIAVKEFICFIDWAKGRIKQSYDKDYDADDRGKELVSRVNNLEKFYDEKTGLHFTDDSSLDYLI